MRHPAKRVLWFLKRVIHHLRNIGFVVTLVKTIAFFLSADPFDCLEQGGSQLGHGAGGPGALRI